MSDEKGKDSIADAAFPVDTGYTISPGLTKREWFAGMALCGICANSDYADVSLSSTAEEAVRHADALIKALNNE